MAEYFIHLAIMVVLYSMLAQGFNVSFGLTGLFNLAHVGVYSLGAYATALLMVDAGSPWATGVLVSILIASLFALILGGVALRLHQDYFALGTLAFASVITALLINWKELTRGVLGIPGIPRPSILGISMDENRAFLIGIFLCAILVHAALYLIFRGKIGRLFRSVRESGLIAQSLGVNVRLVRTWSFVVASAVAGLSGSWFAVYLNYIDPSSFALNEMIFVMTICLVGSPGSFWGCIGGAAFLVLLPEPLRFIDIPSSILGPARQLLYAVILFVVVYIRRNNLFPQERKV